MADFYRQSDWEGQDQPSSGGYFEEVDPPAYAAPEDVQSSGLGSAAYLLFLVVIVLGVAGFLGVKYWQRTVEPILQEANLNCVARLGSLSQTTNMAEEWSPFPLNQVITKDRLAIRSADNSARNVVELVTGPTAKESWGTLRLGADTILRLKEMRYEDGQLVLRGTLLQGTVFVVASPELKVELDCGQVLAKAQPGSSFNLYYRWEGAGRTVGRLQVFAGSVEATPYTDSKLNPQEMEEVAPQEELLLLNEDKPKLGTFKPNAWQAWNTSWSTVAELRALEELKSNRPLKERKSREDEKKKKRDLEEGEEEEEAEDAEPAPPTPQAAPLPVPAPPRAVPAPPPPPERPSRALRQPIVKQRPIEERLPRSIAEPPPPRPARAVPAPPPPPPKPQPYKEVDPPVDVAPPPPPPPPPLYIDPYSGLQYPGRDPNEAAPRTSDDPLDAITDTRSDVLKAQPANPDALRARPSDSKALDAKTGSLFR